MTRILKQRVMHFGSYTNPVIPYDGETTLIGGPNGAGKSSFLEAMRYALGNSDLQHLERHKEYYTRDKGEGRHRYSAATLTLSNRTVNDKPGTFIRIGIRNPEVTLGVVYVPKPDGKQPRYHIAEGDLEMKQFVEEAKSKGTSRREFRSKLATCRLTQSIIDHIFVKQGTAGEYAKKKPRDLYLTVLSQSGHDQTKQEYETALHESSQTHKILRERELDAKRCHLDLQEIKNLVRDLEEFESKERELGHLEHEEMARRYWTSGRERRKLDTELGEADDFLKDCENQIWQVAEEITQDEKTIEDLHRRIDEYEIDRINAEQKRDESRDKKDQCEFELQKIFESHTQWNRVQYAPSISKAKELYEQSLETLTRNHHQLENLQNERGRVKGLKSSIEKGELSPPIEVQTAVEEARKRGITVEILGNVIGSQNGLVEAALGERMWSIICQPEKVLQVASICKNHRCTIPVLAKDNRYWEDWDIQNGLLKTQFGIIASPTPDPRHLIQRTRAQIEKLERSVTRLDADIQQSNRLIEEAKDKIQEAGQVLKDAQAKARMGDKAPDKTAARQAFADAESAYNEAKDFFEDMKRNTPDRLREELREHQNELEPKKTYLNDLQIRKEAAQEIKNEYPERINELDAVLRGLEELPPEYKEQAQNLDEPMRRQYEIERNIKEVKAYLERHEKPDPEVRFRATNLEQRHDDLQRRIRETQEAYEGTVKALEEAQHRYGQTANSVMEAFKKRFEAVSESFHVKPSVDFTRITTKTTTDEINAATLDISIQFDDKPPLKLRGGLSGGEGAVAGLLLRLCMMSNDTAGFFVVDEPYQSLDEKNVRLIAEFLENSDYQVIMVVPNSQDPNQYRGALRGVRVRAQGTDGASPPPDMIGLESTREAGLVA